MSAFQDKCGLGIKKARIVLQTFLDLEILKEFEGKYLLNDVQPHFIRLKISTIKFCLNFLNADAFKVYCYLKNKYDMHVYYQYDDNYFFTKKELMIMMGYNPDSPSTKRKINDILSGLYELELIRYNPEFVCKHGQCGGRYYELYKVNEECPAQLMSNVISDEELVIEPLVNIEEIKLKAQSNLPLSPKEEQLMRNENPNIDFWGV